MERELKKLYEAAICANSDTDDDHGDGEPSAVHALTLLRKRVGEALPLVAYQYVDYAHWQREAIAPVLAEQLAYWREQLGDDVSPIELPYDGRHPATASFAAEAVTVRVPRELANAVRAVARAHGATMYMTLLAAWQLLLHVYSRQAQVTVGSPIAGRNRTEFDETVGVFVNTLVLRARFESRPSAVYEQATGSGDESKASGKRQTIGALLAQVKRAVLGAFDNQDVPFEQLVKELQPERDERRNPLFQVFFDVTNADTTMATAGGGGSSLSTTTASASASASGRRSRSNTASGGAEASATATSETSESTSATATTTATATASGEAAEASPLQVTRWGDVTVETHEPATASTQFELALSLSGERDGSLSGELEYARELFERATVERMAEHWLELLRSVAQREGGVDVPLNELYLLSASERELEREQWNATEDASWPHGETLHSLLDEQAARTPAACAVRDGERSVSYATLCGESRLVARALCERGVRHEHLVGVLMSRGAELVAALYGVLRAGAAYVALDAAWPAERLVFVARNARLRYVVTDRRTWQQCSTALSDAMALTDDDRAVGDDDDKAEGDSGDNETLFETLFCDELLSEHGNDDNDDDNDNDL